MEWLIAHYSLMPVNLLQLASAAVYLFGMLVLMQVPRMRGLLGLLLLEVLLLAFNFSEETGLGRLDHLVTPVFSLCTGPAFFLFVRHLVYGDRAWHWRELGHFVPALMALPFTGWVQWVLALGTLSLVLYGVMTFRLLGRYHEALAQMAVDGEPQALPWLTRFIWLFALLAITDAVRVNAQPYVDHLIRNSWYLSQQLLVSAAFVWLLFMAIRQPAVFQLLSVYERELKPSRRTAATELDHALFAQLDQQLRKAQWFLTPRLSLQQLSDHTGLSVKDISGAINRGGGQSFADYINGLRVAHVQTLLQTRPDTPIATLAERAGFNSKTAFNQAFRQSAGMTPSAYLRCQVRNPATRGAQS